VHIAMLVSDVNGQRLYGCFAMSVAHPAMKPLPTGSTAAVTSVHNVQDIPLSWYQAALPCGDPGALPGSSALICLFRPAKCQCMCV